MNENDDFIIPPPHVRATDTRRAASMTSVDAVKLGEWSQTISEMLYRLSVIDSAHFIHEELEALQADIIRSMGEWENLDMEAVLPPPKTSAGIGDV